MSARIKSVLKGLFCFAFWIGVWQLMAVLVNKAIILPTPLATLKRIVELALHSDFYRIIGNSFEKIAIGLLLGTALGVLLALLSAFALEFLISPVVTVIKSTPVASIIIVMLYVLGKDLVPVTVTMMMVIPILYQNVLHGIKNKDPKLYEVATVFHFSMRKKVHLIYWPSIKPFFAAALKTSLGLAWKAGIAAEVICTPKLTIGSMLYDAKVYLESEDMFAWTLVVIVLSFIIEKLLGKLVDITLGGKRK